MAAPEDLYDPAAFVAGLANQSTLPRALIGLDPGTRTIGVAISDVDWTMASPVKTIRRTKFTQDVGVLKEILTRESIAGLVIGMPYNMDGSSGPRAQSVRAFRRLLAEHVDLPMLFWDERLSSSQAADTLKAAGRSARERQETIDAAAAAHILSDALPTLRELVAN
ncbi:MAG: Holliday junction resolvase RuvX [Hyphomicrobiales bacterium]